jgi:hypothetical protein
LNVAEAIGRQINLNQLFFAGVNVNQGAVEGHELESSVTNQWLNGLLEQPSFFVPLMSTIVSGISES